MFLWLCCYMQNVCSFTLFSVGSSPYSSSALFCSSFAAFTMKVTPETFTHLKSHHFYSLVLECLKNGFSFYLMHVWLGGKDVTIPV